VAQTAQVWVQVVPLLLWIRPAATSPTTFLPPFQTFPESCQFLFLDILSLPHLSSSDPSGALNFNGKAVLHASGVDFSNGASFAINMGQLQLDEELGKGNYGTVKKVLHKPTKVAMAMKVLRSNDPYDMRLTRFFFSGNTPRAR